MSRRELAVAVADWVEEHYGERPGLDEKAVGRLERGEIRRPGRRYREGLRAVLGVATDRELGFERSGQRPPDGGLEPLAATSASFAGILGNVRRRDFLVGATGALVGAPLVVPGLAQSGAAAPARVGASDIERVREALGVFGS